MRLIICTQRKFNDLNKKANRLLKCDKWCNPIIHPDTKEIGFTVKDRVLPILKGETIVDLTSDWTSDEL